MRFPLFKDNWLNYNLTNLGKFNRGKSKHRPRDDEKLYGGKYPFIQTGDIKRANLYINAFEQTYSDFGLNQSKLWKKGTLCITIAANIAETAILDMDACFPDSVIGWESNDLTTNIFIKYYFDFYKEKIKKLSVGGAQENLNLDKLGKLNFKIPTVEEQSKISKFIALLDDRIETQIKIIECKLSHMNYISNVIFSSLKECCPLNQFVKFGKAGGTPKSTIKQYYNGDIPFLSITDINNQGKYITEATKSITQEGLKNSSAWIVPKNSLILSMYASVGFPTINRIDLATSQAMFAMVLNDEDDLDFLYYYLLYFQQNKLNKLLETGTQSNINADTVRAIPIPIFTKQEKQFINKTLNSIYNNIEIEKDILYSLKKQKEYLLRNMFV